jgi:hypothetical protein
MSVSEVGGLSTSTPMKLLKVRYIVSNTSYFDKVQRGPRFLKLEELRREREAAEKVKQDREKAAQKNENSGLVEDKDRT